MVIHSPTLLSRRAGAVDTVRRLALTGGDGCDVACLWRSRAARGVPPRRGIIVGPLWFFLMNITLFPLSVGPQP